MSLAAFITSEVNELCLLTEEDGGEQQRRHDGECDVDDEQAVVDLLVSLPLADGQRRHAAANGDTQLKHISHPQ